MSTPFQTILLIGGTGTWGNAATAFLLRATTATLRIFSRDEVKQGIMAQRFQYNPRLRFFLGDIRDIQRLEIAMHGVDLVFHAAALKQVPSGEYNIGEVLRTNIVGTENVTMAARRCGVGKVVFLSSDKACMPVNSYGLSKAMAERIMVQANGYAPYGTEYCCVRYGNVHGSRGSVAELWEQRLRDNKPLPVTDLTMTRFFLTAQQAVQAAWAAATWGPRGGILVPHLPAYDLQTLSGAMHRLHEKPLEQIQIVGVRVGEKRHEDLLSDEEASRLAIYSMDGTAPLYYCIMPAAPTWATVPMTGLWHYGGLDRPYNSGTWHERLTVEQLTQAIQAETTGESA